MFCCKCSFACENTFIYRLPNESDLYVRMSNQLRCVFIQLQHKSLFSLTPHDKCNKTAHLDCESRHISRSLSLFPFRFLPHINSYYIQTTIFHHPPLPNLFLPSISPTLSRVFLTRTCFSS